MREASNTSPASLPAGRKSIGHRGCEFHVADPEPRESDPAEIVDPLDAGRHQVRRRRREANEFRADADLDLGARRQRVIGLAEGDGMAADPRLAPRHFGRHHIHAGRADEIADEGVRRPVEQFLRRAGLHHAAVMHHHHGVGEGQRLGLVVGDVDHRQIERAMQRLEFRAQLPFQMRIDHRQRLVEQDRGDVGTHQPAAERNLLLGIGGEPRRLALQMRGEVEQFGDLRHPRLDLRLRHAAVLQAGTPRFSPTVMVS